MSEAKYPLCEAAGLGKSFQRMMIDGEPRNYNDYQLVISACDIEKWLESAPVVRGRHEMGDATNWVAQKWSCESDSHTARLVCIEPIRKETAESLLRELIDANYEVDTLGSGQKYGSALYRARKLLGLT